MDSLDHEIIDVLREDGRIAFAGIAKKLKVSSGIVQARFNRMKKAGVIKGSTLILDLEKMGVAFNASIGIKAVDSELEDVISFVNGLKIEEGIIFSWITFGRYNIAVAIFSKNLLQAHRVMELIKRHASVLKVSISLANINLDDPVVQRYTGFKSVKKISALDKLDTEVLRILSKDARTPFNKIGKILGVSTQTIFRRFEALQKEGIISGSTVVLSSKAIGIKGLCGLYIKLKPGSSIIIARDKITNNKKLISVHPKWGEYDFYIDVFYSDFQEITDLIANLRMIKEILAIEPMMYALPDWSIPFMLPFEVGIPAWAFGR